MNKQIVETESRIADTSRERARLKMKELNQQKLPKSILYSSDCQLRSQKSPERAEEAKTLKKNRNKLKTGFKNDKTIQKNIKKMKLEE